MAPRSQTKQNDPTGVTCARPAVLRFCVSSLSRAGDLTWGNLSRRLTPAAVLYSGSQAIQYLPWSFVPTVLVHLYLAISALGNARHAPARLAHLSAGRPYPFVQDGERARIAIDRHT